MKYSQQNNIRKSTVNLGVEKIEKPFLSIVIGTHNSEEYIERCIKSLISQSCPRKEFEIIVIDDGSTDRSVELSRNSGADLVIKTDPCTISKARNLGVKNSKGKFLAFIDSDCEANDGWVNSIIKELQELPAITGPVLNGNSHNRVAWAEYFLEFGEFHERKKRSQIRFMPGCNGAFRRETFLQAGGFPDLRASEDVLLGESLKKAQVGIQFIPEVKIKHLCRTNLQRVRANMELLGKYFVRTRQKEPSTPYSFLIKNKSLIGLIFIFKIFISAKHAIKAKKAFKFLSSFPFIVVGVFSFCKGIFKEINLQRNSQ